MNFTNGNRVRSVNPWWIWFNLVTNTMTIDWFAAHDTWSAFFANNSFFIPFNRLIWYSNHRIDEVQNKREETITTIRKCRAENYIIKTIRQCAHMHSDAAADSRNGMFELDSSEFMYFVIHHVGWLMNYHHYHPRLGSGHTIVLTTVGHGQMRCHYYEFDWKETKERERKKMVCAAMLMQPHGIFLPLKNNIRQHT